MQMISIVIPLYNKELYIKRALTSIFSQTVDDYEIIVVDDGSTDNGPELVTQINDPRVRLIHQKNAGVSAARNRGIDDAKGDLIAFLDADDEWKPEFLDTISNLRNKFPDAGLYACAYCTFLPGGKIEDHQEGDVHSGSQEKILHNYFKSANNGEAALHISGVVVPKCIAEEVGGFLVGERLGEDLEFFTKVAIKYPVAYSERTGVIYYRDIEDSAVNSNIMVTDLPFIITARRNINDGSIDKSMVSDLLDYIAIHQLWIIRRDVITGNIGSARIMLSDCHTSKHIINKLWWHFWAVMPRTITSAVFNFKEYLNR